MTDITPKSLSTTHTPMIAATSTSKPLLPTDKSVVGNKSGRAVRIRGGEYQHGMRSKVADMIHRVGDKLEHVEKEDRTSANEADRPHQGLRIIEEDGSTSARNLTNALRDDQSSRHRAHATKVSPVPNDADLHLPAATQDFLHGDDGESKRIDGLGLRDHHSHRSTIVTPPGPAPGADPGPEREHTHRRPSAWSSDSHYSDDPSEGTIESDEEARELLAVADSGPAPVEDSEEGVVEDDGPSKEQVKKAKEVLMQPARKTGRVYVVEEDE